MRRNVDEMLGVFGGYDKISKCDTILQCSVITGMGMLEESLRALLHCRVCARYNLSRSIARR